MGEKIYDERYGIDSSSSKIKSFHSSRRMFAIKDRELLLAPENVTYSHAKWFEIMGWMDSDDDSLMEKLTRGYFDLTGVYFYKGYNFDVDEISEKEMISVLKDLVDRSNINPELHLFGGKTKQEIGGNWPIKKDYGSIKKLL